MNTKQTTPETVEGCTQETEIQTVDFGFGVTVKMDTEKTVLKSNNEVVESWKMPI